MRPLLVIIASISLFFVFLVPAVAIDTRGIEAVRAKKVLEAADLQAIDAFVAQAVSEILNTDDFSSVSSIRSIILANSASNEAGQVQFVQQFSESARKHITAALQKAEGLTQPGRSFKVITNLLMVVNGLANPQLVDIPLKYMDSKNSVISYWAVNCLTNPELVDKLSSARDSDTVRKIISRLDAVIPTAGPETLGLIASFANSSKSPEAENLLFKVADRRIASYADWSVKHELLDATILQMLSDRMSATNPDKATAGQRFCQLFSYVFQRYIKGADSLSSSHKEQLASVLVETERTSLSKLTGKPQASVKKAIESGDLNALLQEHNNLLGDTSKPGQLLTVLGLDYGKDKSGTAMTQPTQLASPPQPQGLPPEKSEATS